MIVKSILIDINLFIYKMAYESLQIGLLVLGILNLIVFIAFLGLYIKRINKLDKLASSDVPQDKLLKVKVIFIIMLIILQTLHIFLSQWDTSYYMHPYSNFSLIDILGIIDLFFQIYIIMRQHKKKTRRSKSVLFFWVLACIQQATVICLVEIIRPNTGIVLPIFKLVINSILIILTIMTQPNQSVNIQLFRESSLQSTFISRNNQNSQKYDKNNQKIYIEFNKQFQVSLIQAYYEFSFKIAVHICGNFHIITRSETQFANLSKEMTEFFPNTDIVQLKSISRISNCNDVPTYGQQRRKVYENYLLNLTKTNEYYAAPLMSFLQIHEERRNILQKSKGALLKRDTINTAYQQKLKKPFFQVSWKDQKIFVSNPQILQFYVNKTNEQIINFHNRLISQKKLQIELISETFDQNQLSHFIQRIANSKFYWQYFAQWMCLGSNISQKIQKFFDFWSIGFENLQMSVIGYEALFDKNKSITYYYLLSIQNKVQTVNPHSISATLNPNNSNNKQSKQGGIMLKKRYNDFVKLDSHVRKFINSQNIKNAHIPSLPPKFSPFQSKTSPNTRRVYFDAYIKDIIKIDGINHCIKLLQFFDMDSDSIFEHLKNKDGQTQRVNSQILDNHLDNMQFER